MEKTTTSLIPFYTSLLDSIENTWEHQSIQDFIEALSAQITTLATEFLNVGDESLKLIESKQESIDKSNLISHYAINFVWAELSKSFLLLWRDILIEQQKAQILRLDDRLDDSAVIQLKEDSKQSIIAAAREWQSHLDEEIRKIRVSKGGGEKQIYLWGLQTNPWPVYRKQIEQISVQGKELQQQYQSLLSNAEGFRRIRLLISDNLTNTLNKTSQIEALAEEVLAYIQSHTEESSGKIKLHLETVEKQLKELSISRLSTDTLDNYLQTLSEKTQVAVATSDGLVSYKEINFQKTAQQWLESEVLPLLNDSWELHQQLILNLKMSLLNISNRITLFSDEEAEDNKAELLKSDIGQPLKNYLEYAQKGGKRFVSLQKQIKDRIDQFFHISEVYQPIQTFLSVPLQSTINQFRQNQNQLFFQLQKWWNKQVNRVLRIKTNVELEEMLSPSEKIVRFIQGRTPDLENNQYNSIFLTKGQIGKSFWIGRTSELERVKNLFEYWKQGYRGALLLTGQRFSGKTLFGELVANHYFDDQTIRVAPKSLINVFGRKFQSGYDLEEALEFVQKHTLTHRPLIWIDDIERWQNINIPLSQNIRVLRKYIDNYSSRIFFIVATSNWSRAHMEKIYEIGKAFQAEINLDNMSLHEISDAILIRHGATHKELVNHDGESISPQHFRQLIAKTYKASEGNIGEALNRWACSTRKYNEDEVTFEDRPLYPMPDFLNPDASLVLTTIMMAKRIGEHKLRVLFGSPFTDKYAGTLQRMIRTGVLIRHLEGELEVHGRVVNEVGRLLEEKKYLKFNY